MADAYHLIADATVAPLSSPSSGEADIGVAIDEQITLSLDYKLTVELTTDAEVVVPLPGPSAANVDPLANVVVIKVEGPRVKAKLTTADGAAQVLPVDPLLILHSLTVSPVTALSLTRSPGNDTLVHIFLGQI